MKPHRHSALYASFLSAVLSAPCVGLAATPPPPATEEKTATEGVPTAEKVAPREAERAEETASPLVPEVELHGGISIYYYQPTNGFDPLYYVYSNIKAKATWDWFGLYFEPRLSSEKMRAYYESLAWIQQAYVFFDVAPMTIKIGKVYKQVGIFWDNTFYGNIQVYEGLKFDPNNGVSVEGSWGEELGIQAFAQYFIMDGHLNASLPARDTVSIEGARRRHIVAGRVQPFYQPLPKLRLELGLSGEAFSADLPEEQNQVTRIAADIRLSAGGLGLWGEVLHQTGAHVNGFPIAGDPSASPPVAGQASASNTYLLGGVEYALGPVVPRYTLSIVDYRDLSVREVLHLPGVTYNFHEHGSAYVEYAYWDRIGPDGRSAYDRSLNLTVMAYF